MSGGKFFLVGLAMILGGFILFGAVNAPSSELKGINVPDIYAGELIDSSSTVTSQGAILFTNASNTGGWFRVINRSPARVWCALDSSTTTVASQAGQFLAAVSSTFGINVWEMYRARGAMACWSDGSGVVSFSYTGQ